VTAEQEARVRSTYLIVMCVIVVAAIAALTVLALGGHEDPAAVVGALGAAAVGALATLARNDRTPPAV
jgi:flagellar basal body-associated protein FliL